MTEVTRPGASSSEVKELASSSFMPDPDISKSESFRATAYKTALMGAPAVAAGFVDTVGTSVGLLDENDVSNVLKNVLPQFGDYYSRHKEAIQTVSDITGMFIPGMAAVKMIEAGAKVKTLLNGLKGGEQIANYIFTSGKTADQLATQQLWGRALGLAADGGSRIPTYDRQFSALKRGVTLTKVMDSIKQTAAFELGVAATMNNSDTLYPADWTLSENILLNAGLSTLPVYAEYAYTQKAIRKIIQSTSEPAAEFLAQGSKRNFNDIIYSPGFRDIAVTFDAVQSAAAKKGAAAGSDINDLGKQNLKREWLQFDSKIKHEVAEMGKDKNLAPELFTSYKMPEGQINTVMYSLEHDPTSILGAYGFEPLPKNYATAEELLKKHGTLVADNDKKHLELFSKYAGSEGTESDKLGKQIDDLAQKQKTLKGITFNSLEPTGEQIPIQLRKPRFYDGNSGLQIKTLPKASDNATTVYTIEGVNDEIFSPTIKEKVGFTADGFVLLPKIEPTAQIAGGTQKIKVSVNVPTLEISGGNGAQVLRQNLKQKINPTEIKDKPEFQSQLLFDAGKIWDWRRGQLGKEAYGKLSTNVKSFISGWAGSSTDSRRAILQKWIDTDAPEWQEIQSTYAPFKKWLHERADAYDGTVLLFRGENSKAESRDIVSMTTNYNIAARFANPDVTAVRVPIDDIIMPIGGLDEWEVIVKGHQTRKWGDVIQGHAPSEALPASTKITKKVGTTQQTIEVEVPINGPAAGTPVSTFDELSYEARSWTWGLMQKAVDNFKVGKGGPKLFIGENDHWTRLSYVKELADKYGLENLQKEGQLQFPKAWEGPDLLDKLDFAILAGKYQSFLPIKQLMEEQAGGLLKLSDKQLINHYDLTHLLNLPQNANAEMSPVLGVFYALSKGQGATYLQDAVKDMDHFRRLMQEYIFPTEVTNFLNKPFAIHGNIVKAPRDASPVMMARKRLNADDYKTDRLIEQMAQRKALVMQGLLGARDAGADLVGLVSENTLGTAAYKEAVKVDGLIEGTQRGKGIFTQQSHSNETNPVLAAANRIVSNTDRVVQEWIAKQYEPFTETFSTIRAKNNQASLFRFNQFEQSYRFGWNLTGEVEHTEDGFVKYLLADDKTNRDKWQALFGEAMPKSGKVFLPAMVGTARGTPLLLDDLSHQTVQALSELSRRAGTNTNYLAKTMGRRGFNVKPIHLPPPNLSKEHIAVLVTPTGRANTVVYGRTAHELEDNIAKEKAVLEKENPSLAGQIQTNHKKELEQYFDLQDEVFFEPINYADSMAQTGSSRGSLGQLRLETGTGRLDDIVTAINNHFFSIGRRSRAAGFISEIDQARMNHKMSGIPDQPEASIWNAYINTIYGGQTLNPKTWLGTAYKNIEQIYDRSLAAVHDRLKELNPTVIREIDPDTLEYRKRDKQFQKLKKELGPYNPFTDTLDFIKSTTRQELPSTMRKHMAAMNYWTSTLTLRFMELGHPILNSVSLATTMPAVIRALEKLPTETHEQWIGRIGAYGSSVTDKVALFNPSRALVTTMHKFFNDDAFKTAMQKAGELGYFRQDVAEMMKTITAPHEGYWQHTVRMGIDRLSKLSDKSEEIARQFAFGTGYNIGKDGLGLQNEKDLYLFANDFANKVIGDYRPQNRPQLFQGAVGMPLGLFQTFAWNYFQRLFSYIENRQWRALATQYATQAAVFGGKSVPGFSQFNDYLASGHDGISNPVDGLQNRFGPEMADLLLYGTLSNIPKLFGADGIALWNRGDANIQRIPGLWNIGDTAPVALAKNVWGALRDSVSSFEQGNISPRRMAEILGTYSINRPIKYLMELATGYSLDRSGEVISDEVRNGMGIAARIVGMRPMQEAKSIETLNRIKATEMQQAQAVADLRMSTRSYVRGGDMSDSELVDAMRKYVEAGGNPSGFARWFRDQLIAATVKKTDRKLLDVINDPNKGYDTIRLMHLMSPLNQTEEQ